MRELGIDIETYSSNDLVNCGVYKYVEAPDFTILLFAYSIDGEKAHCIDLASGEELPDWIIAALTDPDVLKTAFNAAFERIWTPPNGSVLWYWQHVWACLYPWGSVVKCCTWQKVK